MIISQNIEKKKDFEEIKFVGQKEDNCSEFTSYSDFNSMNGS